MVSPGYGIHLQADHVAADGNRDVTTCIPRLADLRVGSSGSKRMVLVTAGVDGGDAGVGCTIDMVCQAVPDRAIGPDQEVGIECAWR